MATPIGNLGDLSPRAVRTLEASDVICCEDTRRTRELLSHAGITQKRLLSLNEHNEAERIPGVLARVRIGELVAVVSDAGTPGVSDPGGRLVAAAVAEGLTVEAVPGANAALTALIVSGLPMERFCFEGFLPRRGSERRRRLAAIGDEERTVLAPRVTPAPSCDPRRPRFSLWRRPPGGGCARTHQAPRRGLEGNARRRRRVVLGPRECVARWSWLSPGPRRGAPEVDEDELESRLLEELASGSGVRDAAAAVATQLGVPRRRAYEKALALKRNAPASSEVLTD